MQSGYIGTPFAIDESRDLPYMRKKIEKEIKKTIKKYGRLKTNWK